MRLPTRNEVDKVGRRQQTREVFGRMFRDAMADWPEAYTKVFSGDTPPPDLESDVFPPFFGTDEEVRAWFEKHHPTINLDGMTTIRGGTGESNH